MKRILAPLAAAFALTAVPGAFAQTPDTSGDPLPAEAVGALCDEMAATLVEAPACTAEQRQRVAALLEETRQQPYPADDYQAMAVLLMVAENLRQIFVPQDPALPPPPRDALDTEILEACEELAARGTACTPEMRAQLRAFSQAMQRPRLPAESDAGRALARRETLFEIATGLSEALIAPPAVPFVRF